MLPEPNQSQTPQPIDDERDFALYLRRTLVMQAIAADRLQKSACGSEDLHRFADDLRRSGHIIHFIERKYNLKKASLSAQAPLMKKETPTMNIDTTTIEGRRQLNHELARKLGYKVTGSDREHTFNVQHPNGRVVVADREDDEAAAWDSFAFWSFSLEDALDLLPVGKAWTIKSVPREVDGRRVERYAVSIGEVVVEASEIETAITAARLGYETTRNHQI